MIALLRLAVVGVIGLSVVYLLMWIYARSVRREQLEKYWAADHPDGGDPDAREKGCHGCVCGHRLQAGRRRHRHRRRKNC